MAKLAFSKIEAKINTEVVTKEYINSKGEKLICEIKEYLPVEEKIELVTRIIDKSIDDKGFYNPIKVKLFTVIEIVFAYTNFTFTAKQKEDFFKLYDLLMSNGIYKDVMDVIGETDWFELENYIYTAIDNIYKYRNSVVGILETVQSDYSNLKLDVNELYEQMADKDNLTLLKDVMTKLG